MYTQDGKKYNNTGKNIDTCIKFSAHDMFLENLQWGRSKPNN